MSVNDALTDSGTRYGKTCFRKMEYALKCVSGDDAVAVYEDNERMYRVVSIPSACTAAGSSVERLVGLVRSRADAVALFHRQVFGLTGAWERAPL